MNRFSPASDVTAERFFWEYHLPAWIYEPATLRIVAVNDAALVHYGFPASRFLTMTLAELVPQATETLTRLLADPANDRHAELITGVWIDRSTDGKEMARDLITSRRFARDGRTVRFAYLVAVAEGLTEELNFTSLVDVTRIDQVTGLPNRAALERRLAEPEESRSSAIALIRLDWPGLAILDRAIASVDRLRLAASDLLFESAIVQLDIYAYDDHTFALVFESGEGARAARTLMRHFVRVFQQPIAIGDASIVVKAVVGLAVRTATTLGALRLFADAQTALESALDNGQSSAEFQRSMRESVARRLNVDRALRSAIGSNELEVVYQPVISLSDGRILAVEALLRWTSATLGCVAPNEFIASAEHSGYIEQLGEWVLDRAFSDYTGLTLDANDRPRLCVNISARQLRQRDFYGQLTAAAARYGMQLSDLEIELSESELMENFCGIAARILPGLREVGVRISLDDFGTGYSSLKSLASLPLDTVKIDSSFVQSLSTDPYKCTIVRSVIELGHQLGLRVVGEGVEGASQSLLLRSLACDAVQGFAIARPMVPGELARFLRAYDMLKFALPA